MSDRHQPPSPPGLHEPLCRLLPLREDCIGECCLGESLNILTLGPLPSSMLSDRAGYGETDCKFVYGEDDCKFLYTPLVICLLSDCSRSEAVLGLAIKFSMTDATRAAPSLFQRSFREFHSFSFFPPAFQPSSPFFASA